MNLCPRCGFKSYERLKTYSHCVNCNHFFDSYSSPSEERRLREAVKFLKQMSKKAKRDEPPAKRIRYVPMVPVCPPMIGMML